MMQSAIKSQTLKEIVTDNFQTASIFEKYSLDFCCRGNKTIDEACSEKGIDPAVVMNELSVIDRRTVTDAEKNQDENPAALIDHIIEHHHSFVKKMVPILYAHTQKVSAVHGTNHPEVVEIAAHFTRVALELQQHMMKEEQMLFPFIKSLWEAKIMGRPFHEASFGSVANPIRMMETEHQSAGDELYRIRELSNSYVPPPDACTTYTITYQELQEFERDLHRHVHLENNILFPAAVRLEKEMLSKK